LILRGAERFPAVIFGYGTRVLSESAARWLVVCHAIFGVAAVTASTHWLIWLWPFCRGRYHRLRGARRFGVITMSLYGVAVAFGLLVYPSYKTSVKLEYLTLPSRVAEDATARLEAREQLLARWNGGPARPVSPAEADRYTTAAQDRAQRIARWFDVKEHWVAVGLILGLATMAVLLRWDPRRDGRGPLWFVILGAFGSTAVLWLAGIVGLVTSATRAV
jgi:hypothetical protein